VPNEENIAYLRAKQDKLGHLLGLDPEQGVPDHDAPDQGVDELGGS
jgi:hypothetical protein